MGLGDRLREALFVAPGDVSGKGSVAPGPSPAPDPRIRRRLETLSSAELKENWEVVQSSVWKHIEDFHKDWDPAHLEEAKLALPVMGEMLALMAERHKARIDAVETAGVAPQAFGNQ